MAQLFYKYGTMNAGKSIELIKVAYNYEERGKRTILLVPKIDNRYGEGKITSRVGLQRQAIPIEKEMNVLEYIIMENAKRKVDCVLVDEGQFLNKDQVQQLVEVVDRLDIPVMVYGIKNDFRNELFEGSYYLLVYADKIEEIKTICWCGRKATMVARIVDGQFVKEGEQIVIGGEEMYVSLCRKHYNDGRFEEPKE